jgi:hypothetical protein
VSSNIETFLLDNIYSSVGLAALYDSVAIIGRGASRAATGIILFRSPGLASGFPFIIAS